MRISKISIAAVLAASTLLSACSATQVDTTSTVSTTVAGETAADTVTTAAGETAAPAEAATPTEFKYGKLDLVGKDGALCGAPTYIAKEKGFFAEEGFDVTLISADTETRKVNLNNGSLPIVNGDFQFFPSIEEGVNVSVVDGLHQGCIKFLVRNDSTIAKAEDLKGLKIGVDEIGGTPHQVASVWLESHGIKAKPEDGEVTFLPFNDGNLEIEALSKGEIDVAALWDPFGSVQEKRGAYKVIFDLSTDPQFAGKYCCFLYASNKVLDEKPEQIAALLRAYHKAQDWIHANPKEAAEIIADQKYSAIEDKELAAELVNQYAYPTIGHRDENPNGVKDDVAYFVGELYKIGYLKSDPAEFAAKIYRDVDLTLGQ